MEFSISTGKGWPLGEIIVPLPPLAEQHRIVVKVGEIMGICDKLEIALQEHGSLRQRFLNSVLQTALAPAT